MAEYGTLYELKDKSGNLVQVSCTEAQLKSHWLKQGYTLPGDNDQAKGKADDTQG